MTTLTKSLVITSAAAGIALIGCTLVAWINYTIKKGKKSVQNFGTLTTFNYSLARKFGAVGMALIMPAIVYKLNPSLPQSKISNQILVPRIIRGAPWNQVY